MTDQVENNELDRWLALLQEAILEREQAMFSERMLAEARNPHNMCVMRDAHSYGILFGACGDTMEFFVRLNGEQIDEVSFMTDGCGPTIACGSMMARMAQRKNLDEASAIEAQDVIRALDGVPEAHVHCAALAVSAFRQAIAEE
jgi:nitrogen fixation NifU-like protein